MSRGESYVPGETEVLANRVHSGDRGAFQELYERVAPALYTWAHLRVHGGPAADLDPQDILQEVWLRALTRLDTFDPAYSFRRWLIGIAKNVLLQIYVRLAPTRQVRSSVLSGSTGVSLTDDLTSVSLRVSKDESLQRFIHYVEGLETDDRTLLNYCGLEEYTCAQAASRMGISVEAASKRWQVLRTRLRQSGVLEKLASDLIA